jgi:hypothetical protein
MPPYRHDMPGSSAASVSVFQDRITFLAGVMPGSIFELLAGMVTLALKLSVPKKEIRTLRPAALKVLCPDTYSGNGRGDHVEAADAADDEIPGHKGVAGPSSPRTIGLLGIEDNYLHSSGTSMLHRPISRRSRMRR